jgi:hypothetical protein
LERADSLAPFDWGLAFALRHIGILFQISLFPSLLKVFLRYVEYFQPVTARDVFLINVLDLGAKTWMLVAVMLLCIVSLQGERVNFWSLCRRALLNMPKVAMSAIFLLIIGVTFFLAPWMYIFVLFLLWAPIFCAGEITARSYRSEEEEEDYDDEDLVRPEDRFKPRYVRYFADKPIWDLGLTRSMHFAASRRNFVVTVQLAMLFLISMTLPLTIVVTVAGYYHSFDWVIVESFFSFFLFALSLAITGATFLKLLPHDAAEEIGISASPPREQIVRRPLHLHGRIFPFFLLALLGGLGIKATLDYIIANTIKPPTLISSLEQIQRTDQQLIFTLHLEDKQNLFRWLGPVSFQLEVTPDEPASDETAAKQAPAEKKAAEGDKDKDKTDAAAAEKPKKKELKLIEPERSMPFTPEGAPLSEYSFVPYDKPLRLVLYFENPLKKDQRSGSYILYYVPNIGEPQPFINGRFGDE